MTGLTTEPSVPSKKRARARVGPDVDAVLFDAACLAAWWSLVRLAQGQGYATAAFSPAGGAAPAAGDLCDLLPVCVEGEPSPELLLEAARRVGVPASRAAVVACSEAALGAARSAGVALVVGVGGADHVERLLAAGAHAVVRDPSMVEVEPHVPPSALEHADALLAEAGGRRLAVFLDYDGTLTPIVDRPELAVLDAATRRSVARLAAAVPVAVVSGRDRDAVARLVGVPEARYVGGHGLDVEGAAVPVDPDVLAAVDQAEAILRKRLAGVRGALVERKRYTVAAHHRLVSDSDVARVESAAGEALRATTGLRRAEGKRVIELRPDVDWDKGTAVRHLAAAVGPPEEVFCVYVGDDVTDEDAFRALRGLGVGVAVLDEDRATNARFRLRDPDEVRRFLDRLAAAVGA